MRLARAVFGLALAASLALFLLPVTPSPAPGSDKVGHVAVFAALTLVGRWAALRPLPLALGLAAYAALTEVLQTSLPLGRLGDPLDWLADLVGVAVGLVAWRVVRRLTEVSRAARSPDQPPG